MFELVEVTERKGLTASGRCNHQELGATIGRLFGEVMTRHPDAIVVEPPTICYLEWTQDSAVIEAFLVVEPGSAPEAELKTYPACYAIQATYQGPYEGLADAWTQLWAYIQREGYKPQARAPWDSYVTDPGSEPDPTKWITELYVPIEFQKIV